MVTDTHLYLLDTNIMSDLMRNPEGMAAQRFRSVLTDGETCTLCTSVIVQCELLFGLRRRTHPRWQTRHPHLRDALRLRQPAGIGDRRPLALAGRGRDDYSPAEDGGHFLL